MIATSSPVFPRALSSLLTLMQFLLSGKSSLSLANSCSSFKTQSGSISQEAFLDSSVQMRSQLCGPEPLVLAIGDPSYCSVLHVNIPLTPPTANSAKSLQSCPTLCDTMDCVLPDSSVHGILQARILGWVAMPSSRGSSQLREAQQPYEAGECYY